MKNNSLSLFNLAEKILVNGITKAEKIIVHDDYKSQIRKKKRRRKKHIKERLKNSELMLSKIEKKQIIKLYTNKEEEHYIKLLEQKSRQISIMKQQRRIQELRDLREQKEQSLEQKK